MSWGNSLGESTIFFKFWTKIAAELFLPSLNLQKTSVLNKQLLPLFVLSCSSTPIRKIHRIIETLELERTSKGHLVQFPCNPAWENSFHCMFLHLISKLRHVDQTIIVIFPFGSHTNSPWNMFLNLNYFFDHSLATKHLHTERRFIYHKECRVQATQLFSYTCLARRVCIVFERQWFVYNPKLPMSLKEYTHCIGKIELGFSYFRKTIFGLNMEAFSEMGKLKSSELKVHISQYFVIHYFCMPTETGHYSMFYLPPAMFLIYLFFLYLVCLVTVVMKTSKWVQGFADSVNYWSSRLWKWWAIAKPSM